MTLIYLVLVIVVVLCLILFNHIMDEANHNSSALRILTWNMRGLSCLTNFFVIMTYVF